MELFGPNTWHNHLVPGIFVNHIGLWSLPMLEAEHQTIALQNIRRAFKASRSILRIHCQMNALGDPILGGSLTSLLLGFLSTFFCFSETELLCGFLAVLELTTYTILLWNSKKSTCFYLLRLRMCITTPGLFSHSLHEMMGKLRPTRGLDTSSGVKG